MAKRAPSDAIHTQITDHKIVREPAIADSKEEDHTPYSGRVTPFYVKADDLTLAAVNRSNDLSLYRKMVARDSANVPLLALFGRTLLRQGHTAEAAKVLEKASTLNPKCSDCLTHLGVAKAMSGQPRDALATLERAVAGNPDYVLAWINLGITHEALGRHGCRGKGIRRGDPPATRFRSKPNSAGRTWLSLDPGSHPIEQRAPGSRSAAFRPLIDNLRRGLLVLTPIDALNRHRTVETGLKERLEHQLMVDIALARNREVVFTAQTSVVLDANRLYLWGQVRQVRIRINAFVVRKRCRRPRRSSDTAMDPFHHLHAVLRACGDAGMRFQCDDNFRRFRVAHSLLQAHVEPRDLFLPIPVALGDIRKLLVIPRPGSQPARESRSRTHKINLRKKFVEPFLCLRIAGKSAQAHKRLDAERANALEHRLAIRLGHRGIEHRLVRMAPRETDVPITDLANPSHRIFQRHR